jgi:hypothetical protein
VPVESHPVSLCLSPFRSACDHLPVWINRVAISHRGGTFLTTPVSWISDSDPSLSTPSCVTVSNYRCGSFPAHPRARSTPTSPGCIYTSRITHFWPPPHRTRSQYLS